MSFRSSFAGLKYYDDLIQPVPREEAINIKDIVVKEVSCSPVRMFCSGRQGNRSSTGNKG